MLYPSITWLHHPHFHQRPTISCVCPPSLLKVCSSLWPPTPALTANTTPQVKKKKDHHTTMIQSVKKVRPCIPFCLWLINFYQSLKVNVIVRGHFRVLTSLTEYLCPKAVNTFRLSDTLYIPPHRRRLYNPYPNSSPSQPPSAS